MIAAFAIPLLALQSTPLADVFDVLKQLAGEEASEPAVQARPTSCDGAGFAQFDFWAGEWDVYPTGGDKQVAESHIERLHAGCAIRETWMPFKGQGGSSLSSYDGATGKWHQTWIGSSPGRVEFEGGSDMPDTMVLTGWWPNAGGPGKDGWIRMTYSANADSSVRQLGEASFDDGKSWQPSFDFTYRSRPEKQD